MPEPKIGDKAPVDEYLLAIGEAIATAADRIEARCPQWEVGAGEVLVRCALRPELDSAGHVVRVWADMDVARSQQVSEIPLPLRKRAA